MPYCWAYTRWLSLPLAAVVEAIAWLVPEMRGLWRSCRLAESEGEGRYYVWEPEEVVLGFALGRAVRVASITPTGTLSTAHQSSLGGAGCRGACRAGGCTVRYVRTARPACGARAGQQNSQRLELHVTAGLADAAFYFGRVD